MEPIRHRKCGYILTMDQSDTGSVGIFSQWTNQTQEPRQWKRTFSTSYAPVPSYTSTTCPMPEPSDCARPTHQWSTNGDK
eukprot:6115334-Pyramimonas_sp.AAC.1